MRWRTASGLVRKTPRSFSAVWSRFRQRANQSEIMDDLSRPHHEFAAAYRELEVINRKLGGVRAIERFLPRVTKGRDLMMLDVAAGACDIGEALLQKNRCRIVALDLNPRGLKLADRTWPVVGDALELPFRDGTFDVVMASLFFHHLSNDDCVRVLSQMWRIAKHRVLVNDLHRRAVAYFSIRALTVMFSKSSMV